jgi:hypothetical protein
LVSFVIAAVGEFVHFIKHLCARPLPVPPVVVQAVVAVAAIIVLMANVAGQTA